jgi:hypothetical protein
MKVKGSWKLMFIFFYGENSRTVALRKIKFFFFFGKQKIIDLTMSFIIITVFFFEAFKYDDSDKF